MIKQKKIIALIAAASACLSVLPAYAEPGEVMPVPEDAAQFESVRPEEDTESETVIEPAED